MDNSDEKNGHLSVQVYSDFQQSSQGQQNKIRKKYSLKVNYNDNPVAENSIQNEHTRDNDMRALLKQQL